MLQFLVMTQIPLYAVLALTIMAFVAGYSSGHIVAALLGAMKYGPERNMELKKNVLFVVTLVGFIVSVVIIGAVGDAQARDVGPANLASYEALLLSDKLTCSEKKSMSIRVLNTEILQELFDRLGPHNVILRKARERNELMNKVFDYEGIHEWSQDDSRVLNLVHALWTEMMVPDCFDPRTDGFSSEEWLRGAVWAMEQRPKMIGGQ